MRRRSFVITAALVMGLALGIVFGPAARDYVAGAQTPSPSPSAAASTGSDLWNSFLDKLAGTLNIDRTALDSAIRSAGNSTADEAVANGTLTQQQADALRSRIEAGEPFFGGRGGRHGHGGPGGRHFFGQDKQALLDAAAGALNLTSDELVTQLQSGQTIAQIAEAQGTTVEAVTDAVLAAARTQLDEAVAAGTLTQEQADQIYAHLEEHGADLLRFGGRGPGGRGRHGFGGFGLPDRHSTPQTPASPAAATDA